MTITASSSATRERRRTRTPLKLASFHTGRTKVLAISKAFHGRTAGAVAATDNPRSAPPSTARPTWNFVPLNDLAAARAKLCHGRVRSRHHRRHPGRGRHPLSHGRISARTARGGDRNRHAAYPRRDTVGLRTHGTFLRPPGSRHPPRSDHHGQKAWATASRSAAC